MQTKKLSTPIRMVTATVLFDGHDAAINIIRRLLQQKGCELIHLGHNRSVKEIVQAAIQEDADAIAISSYQGSHLSFFKYLLHELKKHKATDIQVFAGGGGTISDKEARLLEHKGINQIYTSNDTRNLSLDQLGDDIVSRCLEHKKKTPKNQYLSENKNSQLTYYQLGKMLSLIEKGQVKVSKTVHNQSSLSINPGIKKTPHSFVMGITGTGGSGKSTLIDEIIHYFLSLTKKDYHIALLAIDPTRQKTGGALLGDRIRINSQPHPRLFIRSLATRKANISLTPQLNPIIALLKNQSFNLIIIETSGVGQSDASIIPFCDQSVYVMTSDYGAPGQLEKLEMLDRADFIVLNKFDQRGSEDALKEIKKQCLRNKIIKTSIPVFPMISSHFNELGVQQFLQTISEVILDSNEIVKKKKLHLKNFDYEKRQNSSSLIPISRENYLAKIVQQAQALNNHNSQQCHYAKKAEHYSQSLKLLGVKIPKKLNLFTLKNNKHPIDNTITHLKEAYNTNIKALSAESKQLLFNWPLQKNNYQQTLNHYTIGHHQLIQNNFYCSPSQLDLPVIALPKESNWSEQLSFLLKENLPGFFPYTAGVYPYHNKTEEPTRLFAGEGTPENTNQRFFLLIKDKKSIRLSTAFDPITLYGKDPSKKKDIYGCIGMSGVSIATLDDMKILYSGIDLNDPKTSVSMTINGPAAILMAWFINTAIDQRIEKYLHQHNLWPPIEKKIKKIKHRQYQGELPKQHNGLGLGLLGVSGKQFISKKLYKRLSSETLNTIRGTLQADILKEEIAQNECLFSLEFGLQLMADMQYYFIQHKVSHFYPVSVSGYHIAEAGANPVTQLAFTLANGFTLVEYYLARGMAIDQFAAHMSFFFSNGMDSEYAVIGRVARRIWARAMRDYYQANSNSQKLKYHIQTSGRSLHAQEIELNDIRTTLQAQYALNDNCNSLHTNAYDEAVTTPTAASVRRALAIQLIIQQELGLNQNQNPLQGSFMIHELTDKVEAAVYQEFEQLSRRGGVLSAIETFYQRGKIQDESLYYEHQKKSGQLAIIGVNTFIRPKQEIESHSNKKHTDKITRSSAQQKQQQLKALNFFKNNHKSTVKKALLKLNNAIKNNKNSFSVLVDIAPECTLQQMTDVLAQSGGQFRRKL